MHIPLIKVITFFSAISLDMEEKFGTKVKIPVK